MSCINLITSFARLSLRSSIIRTRGIATTSSMLIKTTPCLFGEPLKRKKKMDPAVVRAREERRKKKIEKQIRRLTKHARQLKPLSECEIQLELIDNRKERERLLPKISEEVLDQRAILQKEWAKYKHNQHLAHAQMLDRRIFSQQKALDELRIESEELYQEAIQLDPMFLPYKIEGPSQTPLIKDYAVPDGDYQDISKKWG